jgi:O-acetyl-ADP-ribose deacetylase (regulator of RNase III)
MASDDKVTSIAFPSIGTGNLRIPHDVAARVMLGAIVNFSTTNGKHSSLRLVNIVVYERDQQTISVSFGLFPLLHYLHSVFRAVLL